MILAWASPFKQSGKVIAVCVWMFYIWSVDIAVSPAARCEGRHQVIAYYILNCQSMRLQEPLRYQVTSLLYPRI